MTDQERDEADRVTLVCDTSIGEPESFGRYKVLQLLGEGGMGKVYKVQDTAKDTVDSNSDQRVHALKTLREELLNDESAVQRLRQEGLSVSKLRHPNIVTIYGIEESCGKPFILMEFIDGLNLTEFLRPEAASDAESIVHQQAIEYDIAIQICDAIQFAHHNGIIHRDLKPSNILIAQDSANNTLVKVVDFGIAKIQPSIADTKSGTCSNEVVGTADYMSPEQCMGEHLDARSDIYSLGALLYEMFTGHPPFHSSSSIKTILQHLTEKPVPPTTRVGGQAITEGLESILLRCLEKDPAKRYGSVDALQKALAVEREKLQVEDKDDLLPAVGYFYNRQRLWMVFSAVGLSFAVFPLLFSMSLLAAGSMWPIGLFVYLFACAISRARRAEEIDEIIRHGLPIDRTVVLSDSKLGKTIQLVKQDQMLSRAWSVTTKGSDERLSANWSKKYFNGEKRVLPVYMDNEKGEPVAFLLDGSLLLVIGQVYIPVLGWR